MTAPQEDSVLVDFPEQPRASLGKAPAYARHLHDCMHETKREVQRLRLAATNRETTVNAQFAEQSAKLDKIILLLGEESSDGESGKGFIGIALRNRKRVEKLEGERNMVRGGFVALAAACALLVMGAKAWVLSVVHGAGN